MARSVHHRLRINYHPHIVLSAHRIQNTPDEFQGNATDSILHVLTGALRGDGLPAMCYSFRLLSERVAPDVDHLFYRDFEPFDFLFDGGIHDFVDRPLGRVVVLFE